MLYYLKLAREAEWRIERVLYRQGKIVGGVYVGRGQEAIAVASTIQLQDGDVTLPCHRDFAAFIIRGFKLPDIIAGMHGAIAEGVFTTKAAVGLARANNVEMPITEQMHAILENGKPPQRAIEELMTRAAKREV